MRYAVLFMILLLFEYCSTVSVKQYYHSNYRNRRTIIPDSFAVPSPMPYNGGTAKTLVKVLVSNQQRHVKPTQATSISHLLPWKKFSEFFLGGPNMHLNEKIDYNPFFIMGPRKHGVLNAFEISEWYQKRAGYCVDWNPDSYSYEGFLCSGITDFGINLFIEAISFKDLIICGLIGYTTGDSLFCLSWYLTRFFFRDYIPDTLKEEYHYEEGRIRQGIK